MKKVVISTSLSFVKEAIKWKRKLEMKGYKVIKIPEKGKKYFQAHASFYKAISLCDMLLVLNLDKNGIKNYIGPSVFAEIAFAIGLNLVFRKKIEIMLLNPIPENLPYTEELKKWLKEGWIKVNKNL